MCIDIFQLDSCFLVFTSYVSLSQEIADGVSKSSQAVQAAEAGIQKIGSVARQQTICMLKVFAICPSIRSSLAIVFYFSNCSLYIFPFYLYCKLLFRRGQAYQSSLYSRLLLGLQRRLLMPLAKPPKPL